MKIKKSLLNQYLLLNFLIATLLPIGSLIVSVGIFPSAPALDAESVNPYRKYLAMLGFIMAVFIVISWFFFNKIRRRLLRLQQSMARLADNGLPLPIEIGKRDEIGQLEDSFNVMIRQLESGRQREREEENLRRKLVADLSHDLRTPLTAMRGHASRLAKEALSPQGTDSLRLIDEKISFLDRLIDNLMSYTLLTSGKYPYRPESTDMVRLVRRSFVAWYPVFEHMGFRIELELPEATVYWMVDPQWMERILDNCYQNVNRHAKEGKYIGIKASPDRIVIEDRGPGMNGESSEKGAGIGFSIAAFMLKEMKLRLEVETGDGGTRITICR